jgi:hypothetical protein
MGVHAIENVQVVGENELGLTREPGRGEVHLQRARFGHVLREGDRAPEHFEIVGCGHGCPPMKATLPSKAPYQ